jgi:succinyl-diaminopimelate desuccinylase
MKNSFNLLQVSKNLIDCPSVTPKNAGAIEVVEKELKKLGFRCQKIKFSDKVDTVYNLYAKLGNKGPNFCFAGHTDVVPPGAMELWKINPFKSKVVNGLLIGRGACDMKCSIVCFIAAISDLLKSRKKKINGSISLLITGDEEGRSTNGTQKVLKWLKNKGEKIDVCLIGEPTCEKKLGDSLKVGRRGSITCHLTIFGVQGHVAYPHLAKNPARVMVEILEFLQNKRLDKGNNYFQPSNLEVVNININNKADNVIPYKASASFNVRYNNIYNSKKLKKLLTEQIKKIAKKRDVKYNCEFGISGESYYSKPSILCNLLSQAIYKTTKLRPKISTAGGASDGRFIKDYCEVVEFGLPNKTMHQVNESAKIGDLLKLRKIYSTLLNLYF